MDSLMVFEILIDKGEKPFHILTSCKKYDFEVICSVGNHFITCKLLCYAAIFVCFCNGIFSCGVVQQMFNEEAMQVSSITTSETKNHEQTRFQVAIIIPHFPSSPNNLVFITYTLIHAFNWMPTRV